jgi:DNA-binding CsgD family transcriptional regulator
VNDVRLIDRLHEHLPLALVVTSAETHRVLHANPAILTFTEGSPTLGSLLGSRLDDHIPDLRESGLAAALDEVAATGEAKHLPEVRRDRGDGELGWWSWSLHRVDTDQWGSVVVSLGVDVTQQQLARRIQERQQARRVALQRALDAVPGPSLGRSLSDVARALVPAISIEMCTVRLLDTEGELHLVAAAGLAASELRKAALEPIPARRTHSRATRSEGLRWVDIRWLRDRRETSGTLGLASRSDRRPSDDEDALLDAVAQRLARRIGGIAHARAPLRARSLELARETGEPGGPSDGVLAALTPRHRTILELYGEGLSTQEISELLVISQHTVRTHVKLACRRLGVSSREAALRLLRDAADARMPI